MQMGIGKTSQLGLLLMGSVASVALLPGLAAAAEPAAATAATAAPGDAALQEVIVTAQRRETSINKVPLSITALTSGDLQRKEVRNIDDIRRDVPGIGLQFGNTSARASTSADTNISIRGISALVGAATTGVYLDDVPLQKTATVGEGFGAAYPQLFDVERVEVLRGPQGTLFGGSTEGGAIRFITPAPSLTDFSAKARVDGSATEGGNPNYEVGGELGGPLINNVLGFRGSIWARENGGYLDHVSEYTGRTIASDTNGENTQLMRLAFAWAPVNGLLVTPSYFYQRDRHDDTDQYWQNTPAFNAPALGFNPVGPRLCATVPVTACNGSIPAHTYGPYNMFGPGKTGNNFYDPTTGAETAALSPRTELINVSGLTVAYDFGAAVFKSITSYMSDNVHGVNDNTFLQGVSPLLTGSNTYPANEAFTYPGYYAITPYQNNLRRLVQEFRLTSRSDSRLTWVTGTYYSISHFRFAQENIDNSQIAYPIVRNETYQQVFGFAPWGGFTGADPDAKSFVDVSTLEENIAAFGEANYKLTDGLTLTAGVRASRDESSSLYRLLGAQNRGFTTATVANGGLVGGSTTASPVTPKASISYQVNSHDMVYVTVAKGYRPGGFNANVQAPLLVGLGVCNPALAAGLPTTFGPDSVWSYEAGAKIRLGGIAQINTSAYHIKWDDIQTTIATPTCGQYVTNAGSAASNGMDIQAELHPIEHLRVSSTFGYDDAHYTETVAGSLLGGASVLVKNGEPIQGVPKFSYTTAATYDFEIFGKPSYLTADYQFVGRSVRSTGPGTIGYQANTYKGNPLHYANLRLGSDLTSTLSEAFYIKNLTNSQDKTVDLGGATTTRPFAPMRFDQTFRPREFGLQLNYRY